MAIPNAEQDWLAAIHKLDDGQYKMIYRHRYYRDDKAHDSEDEKNWYAGTGDLETLLKAVRIAKKSSELFFGPTEMVSLTRDGRSFEEFMEEFQALPFVHTEKLNVH